MPKNNTPIFDPNLKRFPDCHSYGFSIQKTAQAKYIDSKTKAQGLLKAAIEIIRIIYKRAGFNSPEEAFNTYAKDPWIHEYPEEDK